ncbi:MAG TPA: hypothetical protein VGT07_00950 [Steroidobacteraceae bacterium]|nr:hypothetical protein [Steroidobacteraceae bacterium]
MSSTDSTAIPDPSPESPADGSPDFRPLALPRARLLYWSVLRELWEHRWIYIAPLIVAAVFLVGFVIGTARVPLPLPHDAHMTMHSLPRLLEAPFDFASGVLMLTYMVFVVIYCLGALHAERWDRSILFWKSLPVSDATTVLAKTSIPFVILPLITVAITVVTQGIMFLAGSAVLLGRGVDATAWWPQIPLLAMWAATSYHLLTVHVLYYAPFYGWLLLVSGWARRAAFLWATLPVAAVLIMEKLVFNTSVLTHLLLSRLEGGSAAIPFPPPGNMPMEAPTLANLGAFLASPGLWIGFAICALFLAAAVRLRRYQGPI